MAKYTRKGVELDKKDEELLWLLTKNCRLPLKELAKKTGLTVDSVFRRMKFYEEKGVIDKYTADLRLKYLGLNLVVYVPVKFKNMSQERFKEFLDFLIDCRWVAEFSTTMGDHDMSITLAVKDNEHFEEITRQIRNKFKDIIDRWESVPVMKTYKYNYVEIKQD